MIVRQTRLRKYRSQYRWFRFVSKIALIWYLFVFSATYFTSGTSADFFYDARATSEVSSGIWLGDYRLKFTENGTENVYLCGESVEIGRALKNVGPDDMAEDGTYYVYYSADNGSPQNHGVEVYEGTFDALKSKEEIRLQFHAKNIGTYAFHVQDTDGDKWSAKIHVKENKSGNKCHNTNMTTEEISVENEKSDINESEEKATANAKKDDSDDENAKKVEQIEQTPSETENETREELREQEPTNEGSSQGKESNLNEEAEMNEQNDDNVE